MKRYTFSHANNKFIDVNSNPTLSFYTATYYSTDSKLDTISCHNIFSLFVIKLYKSIRQKAHKEKLVLMLQ